MNKLVLAIPILLLVAGAFCVSLYIYYFNVQTLEEEQAYQSSIDRLKVDQAKKNEEFFQLQGEKADELNTLQAAKGSQDQDGDGLSYSRELELGTDDGNSDSDGDGIQDSEDAHPAGGGQSYKLSVNWEHGGEPYQTQFGIPEDWYVYYKNRERSGQAEWDRYATPYDPTIRAIAEDISDVARLTGGDPTFAAIDFVQSMVYQYDVDFNRNPEYPKYAVETIVDKRGDCEDTSFLMASILEALGIDAVLLLYSDHMAVGVDCDFCAGSYYNYQGNRFFFLETTGEPGSWQLGQIWGKYKDESPRIIDVGQ
jgi:hypothetical protein